MVNSVTVYGIICFFILKKYLLGVFSSLIFIFIILGF